MVVGDPPTIRDKKVTLLESPGFFGINSLDFLSGIYTSRGNFRSNPSLSDEQTPSGRVTFSDPFFLGGASPHQL